MAPLNDDVLPLPVGSLLLLAAPIALEPFNNTAKSFKKNTNDEYCNILTSFKRIVL